MQPRTREERHYLKHKENLEKERLRNRTGDYFRYEHMENPLETQKGCPSYIASRDRYIHGAHIADVANVEHEAKLRHVEEEIEHRRARVLAREEDRWHAIDAKEQAEADRVRKLREDPLKGRKNASGQPFNIVNAQYDSTTEGARLQHHDEMIKYRGKVRSVNLAVRNHLGFNPITGEQVYPMKMPVAPPLPPQLRERNPITGE